MSTAAQNIPQRLWFIATGSELRRNIVETYGTRLAVIVVAFITSILVARALGPEGRGMFATATAMSAIGIQFGSFGLNSANTFYVAKDRALLPPLLGNTLAATFLACILAAVAGTVFILWPSLAPVRGALLLLALAAIPAGLSYSLTQSLLLGVNEVRAYNKIELTGKSCGLLALCLAVLFHRTNITLFYAIVTAAVMFSFCRVLLRLWTVSSRTPALSLTVLRQCIGISFRSYVILFFGFLLLRIDLLMVKYIRGATEAGYYSISQVLAENTATLPVVIGLLLFAKLPAVDNHEERVQLVKKSVLTTAALMLPVVVIGAVAASPVISLAFGPRYLAAVAPYVWLMPGTYFLSIETVMVQLLNSYGYPPLVVGAWIAVTLLNIVLNLWAIPRYGIVGASMTSSMCYFLMFVLVGLIVWKGGYARRPVAL